jgi:hypothetical protein
MRSGFCDGNPNIARQSVRPQRLGGVQARGPHRGHHSAHEAHQKQKPPAASAGANPFRSARASVTWSGGVRPNDLRALSSALLKSVTSSFAFLHLRLPANRPEAVEQSKVDRVALPGDELVQVL